MTAPHALTALAVARDLGVDPERGLPPDEVEARLAAHGPNELKEAPRPSVWGSLARAVREPFIILLALAGIGAILLGELRDGLLVLGGLVPIVGADVVTSFRSERALDALRSAAAPRAHVLRNRRVDEIPSAAIVPGDIIVLKAGDIVPADARVLTASSLLVDRSVLTGESVPEPATVAPDAPDAGVADRHGVVYAGTSIVSGRGTAVVIGTGRATEFGRIAARLGPAPRGRSPLQRELDRLVRILLVAAIGLVTFTVGAGFLRGQPWGASLLAGISAAIAAIPEEPPVLVAVVLGLGAFRLLRRGVLVRRLAAQETLGAVDLIITDKTGTLTCNRLAVSAVSTTDGPARGRERDALLTDALAAEEDAWDTSDGARLGSFSTAMATALGRMPVMDRALLREAHGPDDATPFSWVRLHDPVTGTDRELAIGAGEALLANQTVDVVRTWDELLATEARAGRRTVVLAERPDADHPWRARAVIAFADALRPEVPAAMDLASRAGIQTVVVTGDHAATAAAIADQAGLAPGSTLLGAEVAGLDDDALTGMLPDLRIVARAVPEQKLRLVELARAAGRTVAVTGDGVNDAPALQRADVAVSMGSGTAVAREASDLVLGDDSFGTLLGALREGRRIVANVQKGLVFLVSTHVALLGFILIATIAGFGQPLLPLQILWLELFIDLAASVAFEREPEEPNAMDRPPRDPRRPLLDTGILARIGLAGGLSAFAALAILLWHPGPFEHARWVAYTALVIGQVVRAYANRSLGTPIHRLPPNRVLASAVVVVAAAQLLIPFVPPLADAFRASPLSLGEWAIVGAIALAPALAAEAARTVRRGTTWVA